MGMKIGQIAHKECVFSQPFIMLVFVYDQGKQGRGYNLSYMIIVVLQRNCCGIGLIEN